MTPTRPPTAAELMSDPIVLAATDQGWVDSLPGDRRLRHEEGGWIYMDLATGRICVVRAPAGSRTRLSLAGPPVVLGSVVVGTFHTHPNPSSEGWDPRPSATDQRSAAYSGVPWLVRSDRGVFHTGPSSRRGGLGGGPGYPP